MKAIRIHALGGPDALRFEDIDKPVPGPGQALLRVEAVGVNFIEIYQRTGLYKSTLPLTPGTEAAGIVEAVGPGVSAVRAGERVATVSALGSYAQYALVPAERLVPVPDPVSTRAAAAVLLQGITAQYLTSSTFPLGSEHSCLLHAAAGGVGLLLCQLAKRRGARVIGTVSTEEKAVLARGAGADEVILYTETDFGAEVKRLTGGAGVHVVYDSVWRTTFARGLDCLTRRGMMVLFGQSSGPVEPLDPQVLNQKGSLFLTRPTLGHYTASRDELLERARDVLDAVASGAVKVRIDREFPLAEAADAHRALEGRGTTGKVLLVP